MNGSNKFRYTPCLPDMKWINWEVPILEVAQRLEIPVRDKKTICPDCGKRRLTFSPSLNIWRCWNCDPTGQKKTPLDLVMRYRACDVYEAAQWIAKHWPNVSRVQIEKSENAHGLTRHEYRRYRQVPIPDQSKPSVQGLVASPGWREMPLSIRAVIVHLLAWAEFEENKTVAISRRKLGELVGIADPNTVIRAIREMEAIGLFQVDKGTWTSGGNKPSSFRLTWWSARFQQWRVHGYDVAATSLTPPTATPATTPHTSGTSISVGISYHPLQKTGKKTARRAAVS